MAPEPTPSPANCVPMAASARQSGQSQRRPSGRSASGRRREWRRRTAASTRSSARTRRLRRCCGSSPPSTRVRAGDRPRRPRPRSGGARPAPGCYGTIRGETAPVDGRAQPERHRDRGHAERVEHDAHVAARASRWRSGSSRRGSGRRPIEIAWSSITPQNATATPMRTTSDAPVGRCAGTGNAGDPVHLPCAACVVWSSRR